MARSARVALAAALLITLVAPSVRAASEDRPTSPKELKAEAKVLALVNKFRIAKGLTALTENSVIRREARRHSRFMANQGELSHQGFAGRKNRIVDGDAGTSVNRMCENTGRAQGYDSPGAAARQIVNGWKTVKALRGCMKDSNFAKHSGGVGVELRVNDWFVTFIAAHDTSP